MSYFAYPGMWVWLAAPVGLWIASAWLARRRLKALAALGQVPTVRRLLPERLSRRRGWIALCRVCGLFGCTAALAGPLIGTRLVEFKHRGLDVFIAVDCSLSMQTEDLKPNRMAHAKLLLNQIINRLAGDRLGIIAFAGQAFVECPLTIDSNAVHDALESIDVGAVPIPGTVIGEAIRVAAKGMQAGEGGSRALILLTDGEDHESDPEGAAKEAARAGLKIFTIGVGTPEGAPIPVFDDQGRRTGYKQDKKGSIVLSRLDEKTLMAIAQETGGQYNRASETGDEVDRIAQALDSLKKGDQKTQLFNRYENRYQWPLGIGILFLLASLMIPEEGWKKA